MAWSGLGVPSWGQASGNAVMGSFFHSSMVGIKREMGPQIWGSLSEEERDGEQIKQMAPLLGFLPYFGGEERMQRAPVHCLAFDDQEAEAGI